MNDKDIRDLASLLANVIRRMGASYGSQDDWRRDITAAVQIMERADQRSAKESESHTGKG